jgi:hypothetical protein
MVAIACAGDFLMAVVIYPLVGATVFVACMALSFFVSGLLLSLIFGQIFIGDWYAIVLFFDIYQYCKYINNSYYSTCDRSVTLRTVFQFILLTSLVMAIMIGKWTRPHP